MMASCNIPLSKMRDEQFKNFFKDLGYIVPSETYARHQIHFQADMMLVSIYSKLINSKIFLIVDETHLNCKKYVHVLAGSFSDPQNIYLIEHKLVNKCNSSIICTIIDDVLKSIGCQRSDFSLLITDAAPYMICASKTLSMLYSDLVCITCFVHLLHNCAMRIK